MKHKKPLCVSVVQQQGYADKKTSLDETEHLVIQAAKSGAELVLLQELHSTLYFCQTESWDVFDLAEPIPGPTTQRLALIARTAGVCLVGSVFERRTAGIYHNTAVVMSSDGRLLGCYRKMHIPDDPGFYEKFYFTPGDASCVSDGTSQPTTANNTTPRFVQGLSPINTPIGRLGVLVCWDQWYPEAARIMALKGADLLLYPTAIGWDPQDPEDEKQRQLDAWITIQRSHAIANHLPVVVANRCGHEADPIHQTNGIHFWGHSFICGAQGEVMTKVDTHASIAHAELDLNNTEQQRRVWPFFRDRRIDAYNALLSRYQSDLSDEQYG